ncbi:MAG: glycosyltransferase, partial [Candidatus Micrarchaeota archaeon]|nr:glycosyltransferase [Candidatus Micrarchaeota archaeon]
AISGLLFSLYLIYFGAHDLYTYALAAMFIILSLISGFFNVFIAYSYYRSAFYDEYLEGIKKKLKPIAFYPTVAVAMPVFNENVEMVKRNLSRLKTINYPAEKLHFYLLDDSTKEDTLKELKSFAKSNGITYLHRENRKGFKAGALNNMLKHSKEEFIAVFDYDEYLTDQNFLTDLLPYFQDSKLSYLQTEKRYFKGSFFSDTVDLFDAFFFKFVQPSRALNNTAIFAGSCGLIRRAAINKVGGFPEYVIEDTFFSLESDLHNYTSLYIPQVYAYGKPVATFTELVKQQWRYNYGDTQFMMYYFSRIKDKKVKKHSLLSTIDYITHGLGLNYVSVMLIMFTLMSALLVFVAAPPSQVTITQLLEAKYIATTMEIMGICTLVLSILAPAILTKIHFKSIRKGFMVFFLNFALSMTRTRAAVSAYLNSSPSYGWVKDGKNVNGRVSRTFKRSISEVTFSSVLLILSVFAFIINNVYGAAWLLWYGMLYASTFILFYKYG